MWSKLRGYGLVNGQRKVLHVGHVLGKKVLEVLGRKFHQNVY